MGVLSHLEPQRVFCFFEELSRIPRGSGNTDGICDYLSDFAAKRHLYCKRDDANNVLITKEASVGCEHAAPVILQGHSDMVAEKTAASTHDFTTDPLDLFVAGPEIGAKDTTLGGDDGIALAYMLAILDDDTLVHPPLECVITSDEEIGLLGAVAFDTSQLSGKRMINLDSEDEGIVTVSAAGGVSVCVRIPVRVSSASGCCVRLRIDGAAGGHSGSDIDKNRANTNILAGRILHELGQLFPFEIISVEGGGKDNAIPVCTDLLLVIDPADKDLLFSEAKRLTKVLRGEYAGSDEGLTVSARYLEEGGYQVLDRISREKLIFFLQMLPWGVEKKSGVIRDLVETSDNPGILSVPSKEGDICCTVSVRSALGSAKGALAERIVYLSEFLGGSAALTGDYPAWEYNKDSALSDLAANIYAQLTGQKAKTEAIHAGLECSFFADKIAGLDCISIGPDMRDIHTTRERLLVASVGRVYDWLTRMLAALAE